MYHPQQDLYQQEMISVFLVVGDVAAASHHVLLAPRSTSWTYVCVISSILSDDQKFHHDLMQLLVDRLDGLDRVGRLCTLFFRDVCVLSELKKLLRNQEVSRVRISFLFFRPSQKPNDVTSRYQKYVGNVLQSV